MASLKEAIEQLTDEIKDLNAKIDGLWEQMEKKDAAGQDRLKKRIDALGDLLNKQLDQRKDLLVLLAGMARGTGSQGPYSSCCILAGSHLFFVLPP